MKTPLEQDRNAQPVTRRLSIARNADRDANELIGLSRGVLADGSVNQQEAEYLLRWLEERPESLEVWPLSVLYVRLSEMLNDNYLDAEEEAELIDMLLAYTGGGNVRQQESSATRVASTLPLCRPEPAVVFTDEMFVLTGAFVSGTRKECQIEIEKRGGIAQNSPTRKTRYVVIGNIGSEDWITTSYGRKIQKAIELRDDGRNISIISEAHWAKYLA